MADASNARDLRSAIPSAMSHQPNQAAFSAACLRLEWGHYHTKPVAVVVSVGFEASAAGHARVVVPVGVRPAAHHSERSRPLVHRLPSIRRDIRVPSVLAPRPFPHVARHVVAPIWAYVAPVRSHSAGATCSYIAPA